jgi:hypothetical protein
VSEQKVMALPYNWRVTKYDPALRNVQGHYTADDWTCKSEIGRYFGGKKLTYERYLRAESAYVSAATSFLADVDLIELRVISLENKRLDDVQAVELRDIALSPALVRRNSLLQDSDLEDVIRMVLRGVLWCKLVSKSRFYLHFGWDYYMYIGSTSPSYDAIESATRSGLFVDEMVSPYL